MQVQPIESYEQQNQNNNPRSQASQYNKALIKKYIKDAPISILTWFIMIIMFIICTIMTYNDNQFYRQIFSINHFNPAVLIKLGANYLILVKKGQIYRLITAIFLHAGLSHFFMNSFSMIGLLIPTQFLIKRKFFLLIFFVGGIQGNMLSGLINSIRGISNAVAIGASTSICAIMGLQLVLMYLQSRYTQNNSDVKKKISFMLFYLFIISILPGVDFFGHFGSLISGGLIAFAFPCLKNQSVEIKRKQTKIIFISRIVLGFYSASLFSLFLI